MVDRLQMARDYVQEMLQKRNDIVAAFVGGSVARGDATEASDIDLGLIVEGDEGAQLERAGMDTWRDGVYIEAAVAPSERYGHIEKVLLNPIAATHMNDALILYDPTGLFTRVQSEVRAAFMEPRWLAIRVNAQLKTLRESMSTLQEAVVAGDLPGVCWGETTLSFLLASVPLVCRGITPSSTRALIQLDGVWPELKQSICEWEGCSHVGTTGIAGLLPFVEAQTTLAASPRWGRLSEYMLKKAQWMIASGLHREALHLMWFVVGMSASPDTREGEPAAQSELAERTRHWVREVGWDGAEALNDKVRIAQAMVADVEALAADLPTG